MSLSTLALGFGSKNVGEVHSSAFAVWRSYKEFDLLPQSYGMHPLNTLIAQYFINENICVCVCFLGGMLCCLTQKTEKELQLRSS